MSKAAVRHGLLLDAADEHVLLDYDIISLKRADGSTSAFARSKAAPRRATALGRLLCSPANGEVVDHINGNPWDNRRANLRLCSQAENLGNARVSRGHAIGLKGVAKNGSRFQAAIRGRYLGTFDDPAAAARAYDAAAREMFGDFCAVNFPLAGEQSAHRQAEAR